MRLAFVGSINYDDKRKIKDTIFNLKRNLGNNLIIVGGGTTTGAEKYIKKYALELDVKYQEVPPWHCPYTSYCILHRSRYGKPFAAKNIFGRNKYLLKDVTGVVIFSNDDEVTPTVAAIIKMCDKKQIPYKLIE